MFKHFFHKNEIALICETTLQASSDNADSKFLKSFIPDQLCGPRRSSKFNFNTELYEEHV